MATNKTPIKIELTNDEREILEQVARAFAVPHRDVVRAQTILLLAKGLSVSAVGRQVGRARRIVCKWADRFTRKRLRGLDDALSLIHSRGHFPRGGSCVQRIPYEGEARGWSRPAGEAPAVHG